MDVDCVSDKSTRKSLSMGQTEFYVLNLGCVDESLWKGVQLEHGQTRDRLGLIDCQMRSKGVRKEER